MVYKIYIDLNFNIDMNLVDIIILWEMIGFYILGLE